MYYKDLKIKKKLLETDPILSFGTEPLQSRCQDLSPFNQWDWRWYVTIYVSENQHVTANRLVPSASYVIMVGSQQRLLIH